MSKPKILVVDDETDVAGAIAETINESEKYEAVIANSANQALDQLKKNKVLGGLAGNKIRLILLDIQMPGMNGLEFLQKVRKDFGEDIGVCMVTAYEDEEKWDKATSGFVVNYIRKPFEDKDLIATIDKFFHGKEGEMVMETFEKHIEKRKEYHKEAG